MCIFQYLLYFTCTVRQHCLLKASCWKGAVVSVVISSLSVWCVHLRLAYFIYLHNVWVVRSEWCVFSCWWTMKMLVKGKIGKRQEAENDVIFYSEIFGTESYFLPTRNAMLRMPLRHLRSMSLRWAKCTGRTGKLFRGSRPETSCLVTSWRLLVS